MPHPSSKYFFNQDKGIWCPPNIKDFDYSDGDAIETFLLELLQATNDRSVFSDELRPLQTDWVTTYHFSAARANLLRPLASSLLRGARVLELGCGCGAITRFLGETAQEIIAVEGSAKRAHIAATRCQGLTNIDIIVDTIQDLPTDLGSFDVVTIIGVLEYARLFGNGPKAEIELLQKARSFLKPSGTLILAIENKLGLKYLAGIPEDYLGISWGGVMGTYTDYGVATWSRAELMSMLTQVGFSELQQYIAVPDYKLPTTIITPAGLSANPQIFRQYPLLSLRGRAYEQRPLFNVLQTWQEVCAAGLLADLADSLCFTAINDPSADRAPHWSQDIFAHHYGEPRLAKKYAKEMRIVATEKGVKVLRRPLFPKTLSTKQSYVHQLKDENYINEDMVFTYCRKAMLQPGWVIDDLANTLQPWSDWLLTHADKETGMISASFIDATPFNVMLDSSGELTSFDREWTSELTMPVTAIFLRTLLVTLSLIGPVAEPGESTPLDFWGIARKLLILCKIPYEESSLEEMLQVGNSFTDYVFPGSTTTQSVSGFRLVTMPRTLDHLRDQCQTMMAPANVPAEVPTKIQPKRKLRDWLSTLRRSKE